MGVLGFSKMVVGVVVLAQSLFSGTWAEGVDGGGDTIRK